MPTRRGNGGPHVFGDYIGLTTSDFGGPHGEKARQIAAVRQELRQAKARSGRGAEDLRGTISDTINGPCYGNKMLSQKLAALRADPQLASELANVVAAYHAEKRLSRSLRNLEGRDPLEENRRLASTLPEIRSEQRQTRAVIRALHEKEVQERRQRVHRRQALEKYLKFGGDNEARRAEEVQAVVAGVKPFPVDVLAVQRIANWLVIAEAVNWAAIARSIMRKKRKA